MSKKTQNEIPADMWFHVAADALARYVATGGELEVFELADATADDRPGIVIILPATREDARLPPGFVALLPAATPVAAT